MKNFRGLLLCILIFIIAVIIKGVFDSQYRIYCQELQLHDVVCRVPYIMWIKGKDNAFIDDYMFLIQDDDLNYVVCGLQLEKMDQIDETMFGNVFVGNGLEQYENIEQLKEMIQNNSEVLNTVKSSRTINYSDESIYLIDGEGTGQYEGYKTFVLAKKRGDIRFLEIVLYKEPFVLHGYERKEMYRKLKVL